MADRLGLLTPKQVARAIGVSEASVKRWCDRGLIETTRTSGGHRRLAVDSVLEFLQQKGHPVVQPELLGLPSTTGQTERVVERAKQQLVSALRNGSEEVAQQIVVDLRDAGHSLSTIADGVITAAVAELAADDGEDAYKLHRADEICLRIVNALRSELPDPPASAPVALAAALDGDPSTLTVSLAELVLRDTGWSATSLGNLLPFATIKQAVKRHVPELLFLQVPCVRDERRFVREISTLHEVAADRQTRLVLTGAGVADAQLRARLDFDAFCADFAALAREAETLPSAGHS